MRDNVTVLAGGFSATFVDLNKLPGTVIAVNDAAYYSPRWDICVSMDRLWSENRAEWITRTGKPTWLRRSTVKNFVAPECVTMFENDHTSTELSDEPGRLNGTNSGLCAINLAYQLRPKELFLVGFDGSIGPRGERHWYRDYGWKAGGGSTATKLAEWQAELAFAARQLVEVGVSVFQISPRSSRHRPVFHQMTPEMFAKEFP